MNTEMDTTPPAGYVGCPKECGRYCSPMPKQAMCWSCWDGYKLPNKAEAPGARLSHPDWQPPIASPSSKIEVKTTVDGRCPLCGVSVPSTHIHLCSQPQHAERRKGQRWKMTGPRGFVMDGTLGEAGENGIGMRWMLVDAVRNDGLGDTGNCFYFERWDQPEYTMTLIADAPAEPRKPETCRDCAWLSRNGKQGQCVPCYVAKAPPAQEAPKAAPVQPGLVVEVPCDGCGETNDVEWFQFDNMTRVFCEPCRIEALVWMSAQTGTPYKGPERLRNVLARDEMVESNCLGEVR